MLSTAMLFQNIALGGLVIAKCSLGVLGLQDLLGVLGGVDFVLV